MTPLEESYANLVQRSKKFPWDYAPCPNCEKLKTRYTKQCMFCKRNFAPLIPQPSDPSYRLIPLTNGKVAKVDTLKYAEISKHKWAAVYFRSGKTWYAVRYEYPYEDKNRHIAIFMHRQVMGLSCDDPITVDHAFHETLDNRIYVNGKENLRVTDMHGQTQNQRKPSNNTSGYKGVSWDKKTSKWIAYVNADHKRYILGYFADIEEANIIRRKVAIALHGKFACLD